MESTAISLIYSFKSLMCQVLISMQQFSMIIFVAQDLKLAKLASGGRLTFKEKNHYRTLSGKRVIKNSQLDLAGCNNTNTEEKVHFRMVSESWPLAPMQMPKTLCNSQRLLAVFINIFVSFLPCTAGHFCLLSFF